MAIAGRDSKATARLVFDSRFLALGFLAGALFVNQLPSLPSYAQLFLAILVCAVAHILLKRFTSLRFSLWGALFAVIYTSLVAESVLATRLSADQHGEQRWIEGHVAELPTSSDSKTGSVTRFAFLPIQDELEKIRVAWYRSSVRPKVGECWELRLKLRTPRGSQNPHGMDYEGWLFQQKIDATATVKEARRCEVDAVMWLGRIREQLASGIRQALTEHPLRGFVLGLSIGDRSEITQPQWQVLRRTGVAHLLAISGLHIGLLAGFAFFVLRWLWASVPRLSLITPAPHIAAVGAGFIALCYAALAGFALPTQRALVMLLLVLAAALLGRRIQASYLLSWALILVLCIDPFAVNNAGFWLSFAAVAWILYALRGRLAVMSKWRAALWLQLVLACGLFPLTVLWFGEGSWIAFFANLILIPLFFLLVPVVLLGAVLTLVLPDTAQLILHFSVGCLSVLWELLRVFEANLAPLFSAAAPSVTTVVLALLGLVWLFAPAGWPVRATGLLLCIPFLQPFLLDTFENQHSALPKGGLDITVLDVGQGLSVVLRTEQHVLVYDAGPAYPGGFDAGAMVLVPFLRGSGVQKIDRYLQSHGDMDHRGGAEALRQALPISEEVGSEQGRSCHEVEPWRWEGVGFEIIHPRDDNWRGNNASCVLRVEVGATVLLLTGDIEKAAEAALVSGSRAKLAADILLVPHHGSQTSSGVGLLNATMPSTAIVSAGWRNRWGFPAPVVMRRYEVRNVALLSTAEEGAISLRIHPTMGVLNVSSYRRGRRRYWHAD